MQRMRIECVSNAYHYRHAIDNSKRISNSAPEAGGAPREVRALVLDRLDEDRPLAGDVERHVHTGGAQAAEHLSALRFLFLLVPLF